MSPLFKALLQSGVAGYTRHTMHIMLTNGRLLLKIERFMENAVCVMSF